MAAGVRLGVFRGKESTAFPPHLIRTASFYQDRLGTNTREDQLKITTADRFLPAGNYEDVTPSVHAAVVAVEEALVRRGATIVEFTIPHMQALSGKFSERKRVFCAILC